jgi:cellulose synthase/poly-beta-1,6-N-acetylglucosamine synthase-like glycosyltransferase
MNVWRTAVVALALIAIPSGLSQATLAGMEPMVRVGSGEDLQVALNHARPGDTIVLEAGRTYEGPFILPAKSGDGWVTIRGDRPLLSPRGAVRRVSPEDRSNMPRLISADGPVVSAAPGAHHYRLIGLEIAPAPDTFLYDVIDLGTKSSDRAAIPHHFVLQQLYVHGDPVRGSRRGLALNSAATTVTDSYFADFKEVGADSQAICGWSGPGPFTIVNNYLEGAGENIMFGGADPTVPDLVPADIEIRRNHLAKPVSWRATSSRPNGWSVKNLLELKNARRVVIDGNLLEYSWVAAQVGIAVLFTPRNNEGVSPWAFVEDVTFSNNIVRHVAGGVYLLGRDDTRGSTTQQLKRIRITNNLFEDVGGTWGQGRLFQIVGGAGDVIIEHNTATQTDSAIVADTEPTNGLVFTDNIVAHNEYGIIGSGSGPGRPSIEKYFPGAVIERNAFIGGNSGLYPGQNFFPSSMGAVKFSRPDSGDYRLDPSSPLRGRGKDGRDVGADLDQIYRSMGRVAAPRLAVAGIGDAWLPALFWVCVLLVGYTYVGYPLALWLAGRMRPKPIRRAAWYPHLTVVIVAHNEGARIRRRLENIVATSYPKDRLQIVVASDGSSDDTVEQARLVQGPIRVIEGLGRHGKAAMFNHILPTLSTDILVLTDARQRFAPDALEALVADLADPDVGAVSGQLVLGTMENAPVAAQGSGFYWKYETRIRHWESLVDSTVGSTGAITALRRSLFEPLPTDTVLDDLLIPLRIARRGYRVVFEPRARAYDGVPAAARDEFARKARTLAGNFQIFARETWVFRPSLNRLWLQTVSHKALRLALPILFATMLVTSAWLADRPFYLAMLVGQLAFYGLALAGAVWPSLRQRARWLVVLPYTICFLTVATVVAFMRFLRGQQQATWQKTAVSEPV